MEERDLIPWESIDREALSLSRRVAAWCAANEATEAGLARAADYSRGTLRQIITGLTSSAPLSALLGAITGIPELEEMGSEGEASQVERGERIRREHGWIPWLEVDWDGLKPYSKLTVWLRCNGLSLTRFASLVGSAHPTVRAVARGTKRAEPTRRRIFELTGIREFKDCS